MGKAALIVVIGAFTIFYLVSQNINRTLGSATNYAIGFFSEIQARNIANSAAEILLASIADSNSLRFNVTQTLNNFWDGSVTYRATDTTLGSENYIKIDVTGAYFGYSKKITVYANPPSPGGAGFNPPTVLGAITTNCPVETLGNLIVDGRDHSLAGAVIPTQGTMGIYTTAGYDRSGNSKIGGTTTGGADITPAKPEDPSIFLKNQAYPGGYPDNPDSLLGGTANGYPPGALKAVAQSGISGSQYVTDPSLLTYPLQGVTFVELPSGDDWTPANIQGSGILIVHNDNVNAIIKNINSGPFAGLVIADDIIHIHTEILGAVIGLSPTPSEGNCIGNGSGDVLYSSEAIKNATGVLTNNLLSRYGFDRRRLSVAHWRE